jgi:hypothetical protein
MKTRDGEADAYWLQMLKKRAHCYLTTLCPARPGLTKRGATAIAAGGDRSCYIRARIESQ